jgi:hypothetical protein
MDSRYPEVLPASCKFLAIDFAISVSVSVREARCALATLRIDWCHVLLHSGALFTSFDRVGGIARIRCEIDEGAGTQLD